MAEPASKVVELVQRLGRDDVRALAHALRAPWRGDSPARDRAAARPASLFRVLGEALSWMGVISIRRGESDREAIRRSREHVRRGDLVVVHVEGTRQRLGYPGEIHTGGLMIAMQEGAPVVPLGLDTFGWSPTYRRPCALVFGEPIELDHLPRNRTGYTEAAELVRAELVRLWRLAAEAAAAGLPPELPDGTKRNGPAGKRLSH